MALLSNHSRRLRFWAKSTQAEARTNALWERILCFGLLTASLSAQTPASTADLSFEELGNITVTIASKREEKVFRVASALSVVTGDDIRSAGVRVIPEALRYIPGLESAQINAHDWAVSARGFNSRFANRQLVLMDGRTLYSPFSGGVYWEMAGPPVEEIAQIEVIRGPGSSTWGANAMNGVINIVSKSARDHQGDTVSAQTGGADDWSFYAGKGFKIGPRTWARVYGETLHQGASEMLDGTPARDAWRVLRTGLRVDHDLADSSRLLLQAGLNDARVEIPGDYPTLNPPYRQNVTTPSHERSAHLLARWSKNLAQDGKIALQGFWSREDICQFRNDFSSDTLDLELTHEFGAGERHRIIWGGSGRYIGHRLVGRVGVVFPEARPRDELVSLFFQDEIALIPERLTTTVGTKLEHNNVTGFELEPGFRLAWQSTPKHFWWAAVSRALHTPSVLERNIEFDAFVNPGPPLTIVRQITVGNQITTEQVAYELGWRSQPTERFHLDVALFHHDLPEGQAFRRGTPYFESTPTPPHAVLPLRYDEGGFRGYSHGAEMQLQWQAAPRCRVVLDYSYLNVRLRGAADLIPFPARSPRNRAGLKVDWDFSTAWHLTAGLRYVDSVPGGSISSFVTGDIRIAWQADPRWEISLVGQNLFNDRHAEIAPSTLGPTLAMTPSVFLKFAWRSAP